MSKRKKDNPGGLVTLAHCKNNVERFRGDMNDLKGEIRVVKTALIGTDLQGGLVKKLNDVEASVKASQKAQSSIWNFVKAILIAVVSAVITAVTIGAFPA